MSSGRRTPGFSIVELLVALAIFGLTGVAFTAVLASNMRGNRLSQELTEAANLAQSRIELLRLSTASTDFTNGAHAEAGTFNGSGASGGIYTRSWNAADVSGAPAGTKDVTITVSWTDVTPQSIALRTILISP